MPDARAYTEVCYEAAKRGDFKSNEFAQQLCWQSVSDYAQSLIHWNACAAKDPRRDPQQLAATTHTRVESAYKYYLCFIAAYYPCPFR